MTDWLTLPQLAVVTAGGLLVRAPCAVTVSFVSVETTRVELQAGETLLAPFGVVAVDFDWSCDLPPACGPDGCVTGNGYPLVNPSWRGRRVWVQVWSGADADGDGDVGTDADIEAVFRCIAGDCGDFVARDYDGDGDEATSADLAAYFNVLAGG